MKNVRAISSLFNTNADCTEDRKANLGEQGNRIFTAPSLIHYQGKKHSASISRWGIGGAVLLGLLCLSYSQSS